MKHRSRLAAAVCLPLLVAACSRQSSAPVSPSASAVASTHVSADATLKVSAPVPQSPANGARLDPGEIVLVARNSVPTYDTTLQLTYSFELWTDGTDTTGALLYAGPSTSGNGTTSHTIPQTVDLIGERTYKWRVRSYVGLDNSEYSAWSTFVAPTNTGYIRGNELYDPMLDGTTVGRIHGAVTFIPGKGFRMESRESWIEYIMPATCTDCEFSALLNNIHSVSSTEDPKDTVISARVGFSAFNDNPYRLSVDKRGNNAVAWRFITGDTSNYIETLGSGERPVVNFRSANQYFVQATWRSNFFEVTYRQDSPTGLLMYKAGKPFGRQYRPNPLVAYAGRPWIAGERGEPSTVEGMIIRQLWLSPNARPAFANR